MCEFWHGTGLRVTGCARHPRVDLALRAFDFFISDPLHHYMETGMLTGIKARAEGRYAHVDDHTAAAATTVEPLVGPGSGRSA